MTCLEVQELLSAFIDNELDEEIKKEIQEHIQNCAQCRKDVQELKIVIAELASLEDVPVPEAFHKRLHEALVVEGKNIRNSKDTRKKKKSIKWKRIYSIAAVFLVGLFSVILYNNNLDEFNKENLKYNYVSDDKAENSQTNDTMLKQNNQNNENVEHSTSSDKTNTQPKQSVDNSQTFSADKAPVEESPSAGTGTVNELRNAPKQAEAPLNSGGESQMLKSINVQDTDEELNSYLKQLDELLVESNYEVNSYTKNDDDMWIIDLTISTTDSEGKEIKEDAVYYGKDGKIWKKEL
ncbi:anti-sigma factor family protein [Aminipila sp.]|uniref:anti-sigma factor family protein n=1 Tax=Aminipila sp. TaxID=2060095 RepID=UPI00289887AE|nr:zf-HC2 domain-containing protein [Aminipila sp.]